MDFFFVTSELDFLIILRNRNKVATVVKPNIGVMQNGRFDIIFYKFSLCFTVLLSFRRNLNKNCLDSSGKTILRLFGMQNISLLLFSEQNLVYEAISSVLLWFITFNASSGDDRNNL